MFLRSGFNKMQEINLKILSNVNKPLPLTSLSNVKEGKKKVPNEASELLDCTSVPPLE